MKTIFFNADRRLRNGWWMLIFAALVVGTGQVYTPISRALKAAGVDPAWTQPMPFLFALLATWICLRLRRESLASVGFGIDARWWRQLVLGTALGALAIGLATMMIWGIGGVSFQLDPQRGLRALAWGFYVFLFVSLLEETLFRGFLFQRLRDGAGVWVAQVVMALLFMLAHWFNPGMEGITKVVASLSIGLAAIMLGLAYLRTGSLALPVGLHLGWNFTQGNMMGFGVSGFGQAGWLQPVFGPQPVWLSGGEFGAEASVFGLVVDLMLIALLWRWKGLAPAAATSRTPAVAPLPAA